LDYRDFTKRQQAFNGFVRYRREIIDSADRGEFVEAFTEVCTKALEGDCVAQDCVAYFFNKGFEDLLVPNFEYYMSWQILAGANGNEFALEKLQFFFNVALNAIIYDEELLKHAIRRKNITKENAIMVISNLICEGIVDELKLNPKDLILIKNKPSTYTPEKNRIFVSAMERCLPRVVEFLVS